MLRTGQSPFRFIWAALYATAMRATAVYLRRGLEKTTVSVGGSFATADPVYGLSDIDLVIVLGGSNDEVEAARAAIGERWKRLTARSPRLGRHVSIAAYDAGDLHSVDGGTCLTFGLHAADADHARGYLRPGHPDDDLFRRVHPGIYAPADKDWRRLAGPGARSSPPVATADYRRLACWLELQWWSRYAFQACEQPEAHYAAYLYLKLIAEPARIWLWLAHRERVTDRGAAIERALRYLPEEAAVLEPARRIHGAPERAPRPPLAEMLGWLLRCASRIAALIETEISAQESTEVRLRCAPGEEVVPVPGARDALGTLGLSVADAELLPLADWRARAMPTLADEALVVISGSALDPALLARATQATRRGLAVALRHGELLVMPADTTAILRSIQCPASDPVSLALVSKRSTARFPDVPGWSALDSARRAVREHLVWMLRWERQASPPLALERFLTAARAALFLETTRRGEPELPLTAAATLDRLAAEMPSANGTCDHAREAFLASRLNGAEPSTALVRALGRVVRQLPPYRRALMPDDA
jgi:hypothetical protein